MIVKDKSIGSVESKIDSVSKGLELASIAFHRLDLSNDKSILNAYCELSRRITQKEGQTHKNTLISDVKESVFIMFDIFHEKIEHSTNERTFQEFCYVLNKVEEVFKKVYEFLSEAEKIIKPVYDKYDRLAWDDRKRFLFFKKLDDQMSNYINYSIIPMDSPFLGLSWMLDDLKLVDKLKSELEIIKRSLIEEKIEFQEVSKNLKILSMFKSQMDLLIEYKKQGLSIETEIFSMREKLLSLERQENSVMLQDLMKTLDSI